MNRHIVRSVLISALAVGFGTLALPAQAHVTVGSDSAVKGGYATLTFKVPTEEENANTTKIEVDLPAEHPFAEVSTQQKSGWDIAVEKATLSTPLTNDDGAAVTERVAKITWTAKTSDAAIKPDQFDTFPISVGPLPSDTDTLTFKALQTYSNGDVVRWIEESAPGGPEPEHPAPSITLVDKAGEAIAPVASATPTTAPVAPALPSLTTGTDTTGGVAMTAAEKVPTTNQVNTAVGLAIGGIALALIAAGLAGAALAKRSTGSVPPPPPPAF
ncbi:MAG TPA: YcnI family protein [Sporichthyaceae bacterium]|nr:YcnI family protein [Sporichthyaceae bacterium]